MSSGQLAARLGFAGAGAAGLIGGAISGVSAGVTEIGVSTLSPGATNWAGAYQSFFGQQNSCGQ